MNVRGELTKRISDNKEITELKKILGLENGKVYNEESITNLRYSKVIFLTDQDLDGSHIKALGLNLFDSEWNSLCQIPKFLGYMNTPIMKAFKGKQTKLFYNELQFAEWKTEVGAAVAKTWSTKYFKGLGTSSAAEFKEYFKSPKIVYFEHTGDESKELIDTAFNKIRADDRKVWLSGYSRDLTVDTNKTSIPIPDFINKELIHFSKYDCDRSIPNVIDGLKISQRKVLFSGFKRGLTKEIKVAQFTGYVSEHSAYHHGEMSLNGTIVGMAQNFVGSNNMNLLQGNGQFGTRIQGGKDSASERYIFTLLHKNARTLFPIHDDPLMTYLDDDGTSIEPVHYVPIIPMLLVNGGRGIGTGFSTDIMCYNARDIVERLQTILGGVQQSDGVANPPCANASIGGNASNALDASDTMAYKLANIPALMPYYNGFNGTIECLDDERIKYMFRGIHKLNIAKDQVIVTELPIGSWSEDFKNHLELLLDPTSKKCMSKTGKGQAVIKEYTDMSTDTTIEFNITFQKGALAPMTTSMHEMGKCGGEMVRISELEKVLKLTSCQSTTNMHAFNTNEKLVKYKHPEDIMRDHFVVRMATYVARREYMINAMKLALNVLANKARYIEAVLSDEIDLRRNTGSEIVAMLAKMGYDEMESDAYKYLIKMSMDSVSTQNVEKIRNDLAMKQAEMIEMTNTTPEGMWLSDLDGVGG
jgi:DNA topoisomerase-2